MRLEQITPTLVERWRAEQVTTRKLTDRTANKFVTVLHGIFERARRAYGYPVNPNEDVEKLTERPAAALDFYSSEEVWALSRPYDEQDAALFLTAAFAGLRRGELVSLRWRDVDFAGESLRVSGSFRAGTLGMPKWGRVRSVPMVPEVASALARLGSARPAGLLERRRRPRFRWGPGRFPRCLGDAPPLRPRLRRGSPASAPLP